MSAADAIRAREAARKAPVKAKATKVRQKLDKSIAKLERLAAPVETPEVVEDDTSGEVES